jgi:hypothetical protein
VKRAAVRGLVLCLIAGCSTTPPRDPESGELAYSYHPPDTVKVADRKDCAAEAERAAANASYPRYSTAENNTANAMGVLFGALGALVNIGYAGERMRAQREETYEARMRECLAEKGYTNLPETVHAPPTGDSTP